MPRRIYSVFFILAAVIGIYVSAGYAGEKIIYEISPLGVAEYDDLGATDLKGKIVNLAIFRTRALGLDDTEKIYSDPVSFMPLRVERDVALWTGREYLIEEYDAEKCLLTIKKFKHKKKIREYIFKADAPIANAILIPFSLRRVPKLDIGWSREIWLPERFLVKLISIEDITVPGGIFRAYRFTSTPQKFEIWISADKYRIPLKIKGMGGLGYSLAMRMHQIN